MKSVYNPINPGFKWAQAFDFPAGWLQADDGAKMEFRRTPLSADVLATASDTASDIWFDGDRMFVYLVDGKTAGWQVEEVVTNIVILRDGEEIPIGQIFHIPVRWLPTRASGTRETAVVQGQERAIRVSLASGVPIRVGLAQGVPGPPGRGEGAQGASFRHIQSAASAEWVVAHGLGFRPSVSITDTAGEEVEGGVSHLSSTVTRIVFSAPFAGEARFS